MLEQKQPDHRWGPPMPGQGPSQICTVCGARRAVANDSPCPGRVAETFAETLHDYDPLEVDD